MAEVPDTTSMSARTPFVFLPPPESTKADVFAQIIDTQPDVSGYSSEKVHQVITYLLGALNDAHSENAISANTIISLRAELQRATGETADPEPEKADSTDDSSVCDAEKKKKEKDKGKASEMEKERAKEMEKEDEKNAILGMEPFLSHP